MQQDHVPLGDTQQIRDECHERGVGPSLVRRRRKADAQERVGATRNLVARRPRRHPDRQVDRGGGGAQRLAFTT